MPQVPAVIYSTPYDRPYSAPLPALPIDDIKRAYDFAKQDKAASTRRCYSSDFKIFSRWCADRNISALPAAPETVAAFLAAEADRGRKPSTIGRRTAAIKYVTKLAGHESPTDSEVVKATVRGIRRTLGVAPRKLAAATSEKVIGMQALVRCGLIGKRDRALLLLGFAMAARRSEIVALDVSDIAFCPEGLRVTIRKSKTDQEGIGAVVAVCHGSIACPVAAVKEWMAAANIIEGPLFRQVRKGGHVTANRLGGEAVRRIVKMQIEKLGLDPKQFGAHSLRAGFCTSAAAKGANLFKMMDVSRHKSVDTIRGYVRDADAFKGNAGAGLL
jgi:site-specific recombinase XerD